LWRGLRARLALSIAAILVAALATAFVATYRGTGTQVRNQIDGDLRQDASAFEAAIPLLPESPHDVEKAASDYIAQQSSFGARLYVVRIPNGAIVTNFQDLEGPFDGTALSGTQVSGPPRPTDSTQTLLAAAPGFSTIHVDNDRLRVDVFQVERNNRQVATITIGESAAAVTRAQSGVARTFAIAGTATLLAAIALGFALASRLSRPLRRMASTAARVNAGDLSRRIGSTAPHDEVRVLADAFDRMLDRLSDAFARQRGFVADASHELRTPLTVIRGQLEVLARQPDISREDVRHVEGVVRTEVLRMERLVEDLLLLARADEGELVRPAELDLRPFVTELFDALTLTADRTFELSEIPDGKLVADEDRIAQVVRNLARNAIEHTGPHGLVRVNVTARDGRVEVAIEDDGPGIPAEQRDRIFDRFHRTDTARARGQGGAGLGLAIAKAIVAAHGGTITAGTSPEGGARVAFTLPGFRPAPIPPRTRPKRGGSTDEVAAVRRDR